MATKSQTVWRSSPRYLPICESTRKAFTARTTPPQPWRLREGPPPARRPLQRHGLERFARQGGLFLSLPGKHLPQGRLFGGSGLERFASPSGLFVGNGFERFASHTRTLTGNQTDFNQGGPAKPVSAIFPGSATGNITAPTGRRGRSRGAHGREDPCQPPAWPFCGGGPSRTGPPHETNLCPRNRVRYSKSTPPLGWIGRMLTGAAIAIYSKFGYSIRPLRGAGNSEVRPWRGTIERGTIMGGT